MVSSEISSNPDYAYNSLLLPISTEFSLFSLGFFSWLGFFDGGYLSSKIWILFNRQSVRYRAELQTQARQTEERLEEGF